jgi:YbbR domain-containing protein
MAFTERDESSGKIPSWISEAPSWLRGLFLDDWSLKLLALVITLGLWWGVNGQRTSATVRIAGVQLSYRLPSQMEISNDPRREVQVTLTGSERLLQRINSRDLVAFVDLSDYQPGDRLVSLSRDRVSMGLPEGVHIDDIEPNTVPVRLEPRAESSVPVDVRFTGNVADGYEVRAVNLSPEKVRVRGPESRVKMLQNAPTESVQLSGRRDSFTIPQVAVDIPDQKVNVVDPVVGVAVIIGEKRIQKTFNGVIVTSPSGGDPNPSQCSVVLFGARSLLDQLQSSDFKIALVEGDEGKLIPRLILLSATNELVELRSITPSGFSISR